MEQRRRENLEARLRRATPAQHLRYDLAQKRIRSVLSRHGVANHRTLEQKISDAGPADQRINPHVLATAFDIMEHAGEILQRKVANGSWLYLADTPTATVEKRLEEQLPIWKELQKQPLTMRIGQALEIAVYRALVSQTTLGHMGAFLDLDAHDDSRLYTKEEPPSSINGRFLPGKKKLDFVATYGPARCAGIEVKNKREWMYPGTSDIRELLAKALAIDAVPVLIARRIPFVTFRVLSPCGLVIHQTYNQLFPVADTELVSRVRQKTLLGYHDVRVGNEPDARLLKFVTENLPAVLDDAAQRLATFRDLLLRYASGDIHYAEFAARVRRRQQGKNEDSDLPELDEYDTDET
jgi:hypothetical protein